MYLKIVSFFKRTDDLSKKVYKNIILSFGVKGGGIIINLLLIPLTINYISVTDYGIWLTISSVINWLSFFDIGLGNGLRNRLTEAMAMKEYKLAKSYISTTYASLGVLSLLLLSIFYFLNKKINWQNILNVSTLSNKTIREITLVVVCAFCVQFFLKILNTILTAIHKPALAALITFLGQLGSLIGIFLLKRFLAPNLEALVLVLSFVPILVMLFFSIYFFNFTLKSIRPKINDVKIDHLKDILNLGGAFFIVQIGSLVLFQTDNFVISNVINPDAVAEFNIAFKLFSVASMVNIIIITPYWSAYTDAWTRADYPWMQKTIVNLRKVWLIISFATIVLYLLSPYLFKIWIGNKIKISKSVSFAMLIYIIVLNFQATHNYVINGIGKIKLQLYLMVTAACFNIPLSFFLGRKYGTPGVIYANVLFMLVLGLAFYFQTNRLIFGRASTNK